MRRARETHDERELEEWLLDDLAEDVHQNRHALASKAALFEQALTFVVIAIIVELAGRL